MANKIMRRCVLVAARAAYTPIVRLQARTYQTKQIKGIQKAGAVFNRTWLVYPSCAVKNRTYDCLTFKWFVYQYSTQVLVL